MRTQAISHADRFCSDALRIPYRRAHFPTYRPPLTRAELSGLGYESTVTKVGQTEMAIAPFTGPAAPFVLAAGFIHTLLGKIFGPSPNNVPAAQAEQVYEAAADNLAAVAKAGMILPSAAISAMQNLISMGSAQISSMNLGKQGSDAIANMKKSIGFPMAAAQQLPEKVTTALDLNAARALYVNAAGWYPASTQQAAQLTDEILQSIGSSPVSTGGSALTALGVSTSSLGWLAIAALGVIVLTSWGN